MRQAVGVKQRDSQVHSEFWVLSTELASMTPFWSL